MITILGIQYDIVDTIEKMTVADSFVTRGNKIGGGNGEAKFYIGNESEEIRSFFGQEGFNIECFLLKKDLIQYLKDCQDEYINPEQLYRDRANMPALWRERMSIIENENDVLQFHIQEQTQIAGPRLYIKSTDPAYELIRKLSLPNITYLSAIKLKNEEGGFVFYFRLFVDYFGETEHPITIRLEEEKIEDEQIPVEEKKQINYARIGQGRYRKSLLDECPICAVTLVSDDRLLIASHIKPWVVSDDHEKIDPKNGFMLTPTYDFLFDRGFITFSNDKKMRVSPWLSKMTCSKLNIADEKKYPMLPTEGREHYLEYHRNNIFKG